PAPFPEWGIALLEWVRRHRFMYSYLPWPGDQEETLTTPHSTPAGSLAL
ncbi:MAG: hypothetical protein HKN12_06940, partial [Gemmatimonadetes bacterium]|nr:hypothetical protein [Gemmatimonadota bacterium]